MAARRGNSPTAIAKKANKRSQESNNGKQQVDNKTARDNNKKLAEEHLPPLPLVFTVLVCSGFLFMFAIRDFMATGRNIFGEADEAMLVS